MAKRTRRFGQYVYDLRSVRRYKPDAQRLAKAIKSAGKKARVVKVSEGWAVYVK